MGFEDRTCWLVRAGRGARLAPEYVERGVVSVGWEWEGVGDLAEADDADVFLALQSLGRRKPADDLRDLRMFQTRLSEGDVVVVPDTAADDLLFGELAGPYAYTSTAGAHRHARPVRWFGRLSTAMADDLLVEGTTGREMIRRLPEQLRWQRLAGEVDDVLGRDPADVPRRARATASRSSSGTASRRAAPRTAPAKPTRAAVPDRLCAGCGLLRAPSLFADGEDWCRDCA